MKDADIYWRIEKWFPDLSESAHLKLRRFHRELVYFNKKINLISRYTEGNADQVHFADCLIGSQIILKNTKAPRIYDIGSGNGFSGLILAILAEERKLILVDGDTKKIEFLKCCVSRLELKNVEVKNSRFEELVTSVPIGCAVSRGFASISKIVSMLGKVNVSCEYYHFKGKNWLEEIRQVPTSMSSIWPSKLVRGYTLPDSNLQRVIVVTKRTDKYLVR